MQKDSLNLDEIPKININPIDIVSLRSSRKSNQISFTLNNKFDWYNLYLILLGVFVIGVELFLLSL
jgi:hypothetical protein